MTLNAETLEPMGFGIGRGRQIADEWEHHRAIAERAGHNIHNCNTCWLDAYVRRLQAVADAARDAIDYIDTQGRVEKAALAAALAALGEEPKP